MIFYDSSVMCGIFNSTMHVDVVTGHGEKTTTEVNWLNWTISESYCHIAQNHFICCLSIFRLVLRSALTSSSSSCSSAPLFIYFLQWYGKCACMCRPSVHPIGLTMNFTNTINMLATKTIAIYFDIVFASLVFSYPASALAVRLLCLAR